MDIIIRCLERVKIIVLQLSVLHLFVVDGVSIIIV